MRIDQPADDDRPAAPGGVGPDGPDHAVEHHAVEHHRPARRDGNAGQGDARDTGDGNGNENANRVARAIEHRATVDAAYRDYAIERGYARVRETEQEIVTPAMLRIEAADPARHLAGLDHRLKGQDRLTEKVISHMQSNPELSCEQAFIKVKDAIRYTLIYAEEHYADGIKEDVGRLGEQFTIVDLRNSWPTEEYKGINSRWRVPGNGQIFEVQFHTQASFDAKQLTHAAYEKIRDPSTSKEAREELQDYQRQVSAEIPEPRDASSIQNYP